MTIGGLQRHESIGNAVMREDMGKATIGFAGSDAQRPAIGA
jgi:hypothetical protein